MVNLEIYEFLMKLLRSQFLFAFSPPFFSVLQFKAVVGYDVNAAEGLWKNLFCLKKPLKSKTKKNVGSDQK